MPDGTIAAHDVPACTDPVFVLCTSRSGSTLLRFVLDAHPDLACPPEMKLPFVLSQLARLWSATDGLGVAPGNSAPVISDAVAAGIRHTMDMMIGPYLARRGKTRYCDKNLGTEPHVETLLGVYPEAKFICLYRHPMDMIASGVEACPWGLNQYGFEPYVAHAPGNSVLALARYWTDHIGSILAVEDRHPEHCHRVRYEDLVADPETVAAGIFSFLGLPPAPGISARAFSRDRERTGPGDFKIWNTSQISDDSVGRGWSVPADLIPAPLTATINDHIDRLGYVRIDANWGTVRKPSDLRLPAEGQAPAPRSAASGGPIAAGALLLSERLQNGLRRVGDEFIQEWQPYSDGPFLMVALAPTGTEDDAWWLVDVAARKIMSGSGNCTDDRGWTISAPAATWEQVIRDGLNLGIAFRRHGMRYRDQGGGGAGSTMADNRVSMMSDLLGIVTWNPDRTDTPGPPGSNGSLFESRQAVARAPGGALAGRSRTEGAVAVEAGVPVGIRPRVPAPAPAGGQPSPGSRAPAGSRQPAGSRLPADVRPRVEGRTAVEVRPQARARASAESRQAAEQAGDPEPDAHPADEELLPWERDRQPAPRGIDLDAALWESAPAEPEPQTPRVTRFSISTAGRTAPAAKPSGPPAEGKPARPAESSGSGSARPRPPASSYSRRTAVARERLRQEREQESRRRRLRVATIGTMTLITAGVITGIAFQHDGGGGASGSGGSHPAAKASAQAPGFGYAGPYAPVTLNADNSVTMAQPGVTQPVLDIYEDFQCTACRAFEQASGATIQQLADQGKLKVVYYPFTVLGSQPQVASSIRAWAAAKCAPASLWARYHDQLYASQPTSTTDGGFTVSLLVRLGKTAGITSPGFTQCVESQQYAVQDAPLSDQIINSGVDSMLTLKLNGEAIDPGLSAAQLRKVILSASSKKATA